VFVSVSCSGGFFLFAAFRRRGAGGSVNLFVSLRLARAAGFKSERSAECFQDIRTHGPELLVLDLSEKRMKLSVDHPVLSVAPQQQFGRRRANRDQPRNSIPTAPKGKPVYILRLAL